MKARKSEPAEESRYCLECGAAENHRSDCSMNRGRLTGRALAMHVFGEMEARERFERYGVADTIRAARLRLG